MVSSVLSLPSRSKLRSRLARATQLQWPPDKLADLRSQYHARAIGDHISEASPALLPHHRQLLADLLTGGGQ